MTNERIRRELERLNSSPEERDTPGGVGTVRFVVRCPLGAADLLGRVKGILELVDGHSIERWPDEATWKQLLPSWFLEACAPDMTTEESERWLKRWQSLSIEEQKEEELNKDWSLENWLYWMEPENRQWTWWDARITKDCNHLIVAIEVECWPFPWGSLRWLFRAAGASAVESGA